MKEIRLAKTSDKIIGALRVSDKTYTRIEELAKASKVSNQEIVRAIVEGFIDEAVFI